MKNGVRLIFSLIRQQTEMEGGEREAGGWVPYYRHRQGLMKRGHGICRTEQKNAVREA